MAEQDLLDAIVQQCKYGIASIEKEVPVVAIAAIFNQIASMVIGGQLMLNDEERRLWRLLNSMKVQAGYDKSVSFDKVWKDLLECWKESKRVWESEKNNG